VIVDHDPRKRISPLNIPGRTVRGNRLTVLILISRLSRRQQDCMDIKRSCSQHNLHSATQKCLQEAASAVKSRSNTRATLS
jgi:hypothetical protein